MKCVAKCIVNERVTRTSKKVYLGRERSVYGRYEWCWNCKLSFPLSLIFAGLGVRITVGSTYVNIHICKYSKIINHNNKLN